MDTINISEEKILIEKSKSPERFKIVTDPAKIDFNDLERFVSKQTTGNFFQSGNYYNYSKSLSNSEAILVCILDEEDRIFGSVICVINYLVPAIKLPLLTRAIVVGGPVISDVAENKKAAMDVILAHLIREVSKRSVYLEFRNLNDYTRYKQVFEKHNLRYVDHLNYINDCTDKELAFQKVSKSKQVQIRKSLKAGAEISTATTIEEVKQVYELLLDLYKTRVKKPLPKWEFFEKFFRQGDKTGVYIIVKYNGQVIAGAMCPVFADKAVYEWYVVGKDRVIKNVYPSVLVTWAAIEYAIKNNYERFDFMGAGKPTIDYGVREFKAQFGGELVCYGRWSRILNRRMYDLSQWLLKKLGYFK